jgi:hypothetical protein
VTVVSLQKIAIPKKARDQMWPPSKLLRDLIWKLRESRQKKAKDSSGTQATHATTSVWIGWTAKISADIKGIEIKGMKGVGLLS